MNKGTIAAIVAASVVAGLLLGVTGTAAVGFVGRALDGRNAAISRMQGDVAPWADARGAQAGPGMMAGRGAMMRGRGNAPQAAPNGALPPRFRGQTGTGTATCPDCGGRTGGESVPPWAR